MRLRQLGLIRYGAFTDRVLDFDPGARLTVVHGGNEAGKSTALNAVADVLFDIEERSRFNFQHDYKAMRLSATVTAPDGQSLAFARLKRRAHKLVHPETDAPLGDDCLAAFLGLHDRRAFLDIFGLNQASLREGGRKLLSGGGDLANMLLAAAPGLSHVVATRDRLKDSAAAIFNPARRSSGHAFYVAKDRHDAARRAIRDGELRTDEARRLRTSEGDAAEARRAAVAAEQRAGSELARTQALRNAARELRVLDAHLSSRAALGDLPDIPAGHVADLRARLTALNEAATLVEAATAEAGAARDTLAGVAVDEVVLALDERIRRADEERIAVEKELESLPNRRAEAAEARTALDRIAAGLDLQGADALRGRLPTPPRLARCEELADAMRELDVRVAEAARSETELAERRRALDEARPSAGDVSDPAPIRLRLGALDGAEERERSLRELDQSLVDERISLDERVLRLGLRVATAEALATLPLPDSETAAAVLARVLAARENMAKCAEVETGLREAIAQAHARQVELQAGRPAPTEEVIAGVRAARDEDWQALRPLATGSRAVEPADRERAARLDEAIAGADRLADERQTETARLGELARLARDLADLDIRLSAATERRTLASAEVEDREGDWHLLWTGAGREVAANEAGVALVRDTTAILQALSALRTRTASAAGARADLEATRRRAEDLHTELGLAPLGGGPLRMAELREAVTSLERRHRDARDHLRDLSRTEREAEELGTRRAALAQERDILDREAAELFPVLALRTGAGPAEIRTTLNLWREAHTALQKLDTAEHRIRQIEADERRFRSAMKELLSEGGLEAEGGDMLRTAFDLRARLDHARAQKSRADLARRAVDERDAVLKRQTALLKNAQAALEPALRQHGLAAAGDLPPIIERLQQADALGGEIAKARTRIRDACGTMTEVEIRDAIAGRHDDDLAVLAAEAADAHRQARADLDTAIEGDERARGELRLFEGRQGAADAAQEEQDALAEMADAMERFTRDHVASRLLSLAIDRYRQQHQDPIVTRASELFAQLTCGRWTGIGVDYDHETPRLAALRDGRHHGVEALSEGSADQLFLALRIAAIEDHSSRATPLPFIADDLLVTFDEARTEAGLQVLAELGRRTQVLVFTHHSHVVDCAQRALGDGVSVVRL